MSMNPPPTGLHAGLTARDAGLIGCAACHLLCRPASPAAPGHCPRCGAALHWRKPDAIARAWALLIASMILYVPANLLTMMRTNSAFGVQEDTIMSGVLQFWNTGEVPLAMLIFVFSIVVPLFKIVALMVLLRSVRQGSTTHRLARARVYRLIEFVGRWSMLDVFVVGLVVALIDLRSLATITAGPAAVAFGAVVVLTMLAAESFDPRGIWDPPATDADVPR